MGNTAYLPKCSPTVGGGLGGLPYRKGSGGSIAPISTSYSAYGIHTISTSILAANTYGFSVAKDGLHAMSMTNSGAIRTYTMNSIHDVNTLTETSYFAMTGAGYFTVSDDGMYVVSVSSGSVYLVTMSTPWNLTTAVQTSVILPAPSPTTLTYSSVSLDGKHLYVSQRGVAPETIYHFTMSTAWDINTLVFSEQVTVNFNNYGNVDYNGQYQISDDGNTLFHPEVGTSLPCVLKACPLSSTSDISSVTVPNEAMLIRSPLIASTTYEGRAVDTDTHRYIYTIDFSNNKVALSAYAKV